MSKVTELQDQLREARNELEQWRIFGTPIELRARIMTISSAARALERDINEYVKMSQQNSNDHLDLISGLCAWSDHLSDKNRVLHEENEKLKAMLQVGQEPNPFVEWEKYQESLRKSQDGV